MKLALVVSSIFPVHNVSISVLYHGDYTTASKQERAE